MDVSRYRPFGIMFEKRWIFERGGRPVIYQRYDEFEGLRDSPAHNWRHMTFDPLSTEPVDFTWEREWRIQTESLRFDSSVASIVTPNPEWCEHVARELSVDEDTRIWSYAQITDDLLAEQRREPRWHIVSLSNVA
ncbi:hypothetical protein SAMN05216289_11365 [Dokdonella immobilis]|uniref:Uncharacterized protein n=2 Tax=Dokdonella immobilis TaxID=578942 RepID=A0A1I4XZ96_9GAMM|nr:hypothetical protein SAMN05216289_11365 [Dokdonella immobilis]